MKFRLALLGLVFSVAVLRGAAALPLFNATLSVGHEHRFVLVNAAGKASPFLELGESFDGYRLESYDGKTGVLVLEREGVRSPVTLVPDALTTVGEAAENRRVLQMLAKMIQPRGVVVAGKSTMLILSGRTIPVGIKMWRVRSRSDSVKALSLPCNVPQLHLAISIWTVIFGLHR